MSGPEMMAELRMRLTDQMEKDGKRILELEKRLGHVRAMLLNEQAAHRDTEESLRMAESKLVQAGEGFPS